MYFSGGSIIFVIKVARLFTKISITCFAIFPFAPRMITFFILFKTFLPRHLFLPVGVLTHRNDELNEFLNYKTICTTQFRLVKTATDKPNATVYYYSF